jgi:hypothetical protein
MAANSFDWSIIDYSKRCVVFSADSLKHIEKNHPEVSNKINEIRSVVESPEIVKRSSEYADTEVYARYGVCSGKYKNFYLNVVVSYQIAQGDVKTAYFSKIAEGEHPPLYVRIKR